MTAFSGSVLAVLGAGLVDPATPVIRADDPGLTRGDGCFEGIRVLTDDSGRSRAQKIDRHLARFARSAAALGIPFDRPAWEQLIDLACTAWPVPGEAAMRTVLTRGAPGAGPAGFVTVSPASPDYPRQRREGIAVITVQRGYRSDSFADAPWLLGGVKTLSYAINMAAQRAAEARGAGDAIYVSSDGYVLEAPTGSVVWAVGRALATTPTGPTGILAGTTQQLLFDQARDAGWETSEQLVTVEQLHAADAIWVVSSVRGPVEVVRLDERPRPQRTDLHAEITKLAGF